MLSRGIVLILQALMLLQALSALPRKPVNQYTHRVWTQAQGLPQDTIRAIAQTADGYLWVGTDEGLARFDGYRFVSFGKGPGELPDAAITALCAAADGSLWIGTASALTRYQNGRFRTWGKEAGLGSDALISDVRQGPDGSVWVAAGLQLIRVQNERFISYRPAAGSGIQGIRVVLPEKNGTVSVAGYGSVGRVSGSEIVSVYAGAQLQGNIAMSIARDEDGQLRLSGTEGLFELGPGRVRRYTSADGLPDTFVRSFLEDRDGNLWVGTNAGLTRREDGRFMNFSGETLHPHEWVWTIFEDRDGNLWVGANSGLHQFLDQPITIFTRADGLPSDQPTAVHEDRQHRIWVGFHDRGLGYLETGKFTSVTGLPSQEVFSIREARNGDLLIGTRGGLSRVHGSNVQPELIPSDDLQRHNVFDAIEDSSGRIWLATNQGALVKEPGKPPRSVVNGGVLLTDAVVVLLESREGEIWAGTYGHGLWRIRGDKRERFTASNGLPGEGIRSLYEDPDGALWVGTFNGGAARYRDGRFVRIDSSVGLPSDIVGRIITDGTSASDVWFATARGIARVARASLAGFLDKKTNHLRATVYGVSDGLRSAQAVPNYPVGTGGTRTTDGRLWFPTGFGLAVFDPGETPPSRNSPPAHVVEVIVDGRVVPPGGGVRLPADTRRVEFRFAAVELTSPGSLQYRIRLDGVDRDWVDVGNRRSTEYNNLSYGKYTFHVAASLRPGTQPGPEDTLSFERLPHWWELWIVRLLGMALFFAMVWAAWQFRLRQIQHSFRLVLEERSRIAREIHDTLAQGFVGISSQLDAVDLALGKQPDKAAQHLKLARRMSQHSLTEARRSIFDLRAGTPDGSADLSSSVRSAVAFVTAGRSVRTEFEVDPVPKELTSGETGQQIVRIVQEAAANAARHAAATRIRTEIRRDGDALRVRVEDDGTGFDASQALSASDGHFGLLGMQERAERIKGSFDLRTEPGKGTTIEVIVPLSS